MFALLCVCVCSDPTGVRRLGLQFEAEPALLINSSQYLLSKMAEDVNNDSTPSKAEERKIVVEFCQLQEKSRQLFNALRFFFFSGYIIRCVFTEK